TPPLTDRTLFAQFLDCLPEVGCAATVGTALGRQVTVAHRGASAFLLHIVFLPLQLPFLPLYFAVLCNFTIIFGCFNVKNPLSCSIPLQILFSLSKQ
ncbi:hypothetical protein, partial [Ruminococcus sp.]|uniref:hypothetical protein n=1 Tax=Ruminococcus sp. TaxID=41978 RepID=UPI003AB46DB0